MKRQFGFGWNDEKTPTMPRIPQNSQELAAAPLKNWLAAHADHGLKKAGPWFEVTTGVYHRWVCGCGARFSVTKTEYAAMGDEAPGLV